MHFFLNKSGWSAKYGWMLKPDYNRLPSMFHAMWIAYERNTRKAYARLKNRRFKWPPNMGETRRTAINPEWKKLNRFAHAFDEHPFRAINVGPAPKWLPHNPHHQT